MAKPAIKLELSPELLEKVDTARGEVARVRWIRMAIEAYLTAPRGTDWSAFQRSGDHVRSSAEVKADVQPIVKGGR